MLILLTSSPPSLGSWSASASMFSGNVGSAVKLSPISSFPLLDPTPTATPTDTSTVPAPTPTSTSTTTTTTTTVQPVKLDDAQYLGLTSGIVLVLVFLSALLVAQMRRP